MSEDFPSISVVIPTYNSERTLPKCLESIKAQDYPGDKTEIIIADGGSEDRTLEIAKEHGVDKILHNPLRTGEAGKAVAIEAAENDVIALIDSDNVLPSPNWLKSMVHPFKDQTIIGTEPLYYTWRPKDPLIVRYCALLGMNDPLCLHLKNYDRYSYATGKWTGLQVKTTDKGQYFISELDEANIPTMGANGFLVRTRALKGVEHKPYMFDIDVVYQLVKAGQNRFAKVKTGIVHLFASNTSSFLRKTYRRIRDYLFYERHKMRRYPWRRLSIATMLSFALYTLIMIPIVRDLIRGYKNAPDVAWLFHPIACWLTAATYGLVFMRSIIS